MFKLALNAGHGYNTAGKHCWESIDPKETREWTLNSRICAKIEEKLKAYTGVEVRRMDDTTGAKDVALETRTGNANSWGADFYLAIHHNAGIKGGEGGGVVAYVYTNATTAEKDWQKKLYNAIIKHTGLKGNRSKPLASANFHECRETKMPAVLMECGFMDSTVDTPIILTEDFANKVATACVEVIVAEWKLTKKASTTNTTIKAVTVDGINKGRGTNELILYVGKASTGTNKWGAEAVLNADLTVASVGKYGVGNTTIPAGKMVLSGHGDKATWLLSNLKAGAKLKLTIN
jgi:N-acetylmuramoyl-L-alanine amidase